MTMLQCARVLPCVVLRSIDLGITFLNKDTQVEKRHQGDFW